MKSLILSLAIAAVATGFLPACASCKGAPAPVEPTAAATQPAADAGPAPAADDPATAK
jgi:hypothetical protein